MNQEKHLNLCFALQLLIGVVADKVSKNAIIIGIEYILYKKSSFVLSLINNTFSYSMGLIMF